MKIAAILCEYNPFHNGHAYHIAETKRITGCDAVVCLMSGNFTQRGACAITDKWNRTAAALHGGADAVFELPFAYATSSAQYFAAGGVSLATGLGADYLSFGAESAPEVLEEACRIRRTDAYRARLQSLLAQHVSYPRAVTAALYPDGSAGKLRPNDILALEYMQALAGGASTASDVASDAAADAALDAHPGAGGASLPQPVAVPRRYAAHDGLHAHGAFASALYIRSKLLADAEAEAGAEADASESDPDVWSRMPPGSVALLRAWRERTPFVQLSDFDAVATAMLRMAGPRILSSLPLGDGGFGSLVYKAACRENSCAGIVRACVSSSFPASRASRFLIRAMVCATAEADPHVYMHPAPYARLLGFRAAAAPVIAELERRGRIPILKSVAKARDSVTDRVARDVLTLDLRAQDLYASVLRDPVWSRAVRDCTEPMVIL